MSSITGAASVSNSNMSARTRVVLSWVAIALGAYSMARGYGPWLFIAALGVSHICRYVLKPPIPDLSRRGLPLRPRALSVALLIGLMVVLTVMNSLWPEAGWADIVNWAVAAALMLSLTLTYLDIRWICCQRSVPGAVGDPGRSLN
jgi:hypothetical protein